MSDKFGRHKSTRWVKASVPTYGDEWDDDYDGGYDYGYDSQNASDNESVQFEAPLNRLSSKDRSESNSEEKIQDPQDSTHDLKEDTKNKQPEDLVLSIDRFSSRNQESSDEDDEDDDRVLLGDTDHPSELQRKGTIQNPISVDSTLNDTNNQSGSHISFEPDETFNFSPVEQNPNPTLPSPVADLAAPKFDSADNTQSTTQSEKEKEPVGSMSASYQIFQKKNPSLNSLGSSVGSSISKKSSRRKPPSLTISGKVVEDENFLPPTPTFNSNQELNNYSETPRSEQSFQSDADSIQQEPTDLNIASPNSRKYSPPKPSTEDSNGTDLLDVIQEAEKSSSEPPSHSLVDNSFSSLYQDESLEDDSIAVGEDGRPAPLVLSIDNKNRNNHNNYNDDDDDSSDDDWGYNSQNSSNREDDEMNDLNVSRSKDLSSSSNNESRAVKTDALDSLINDLEKASFSNHVSDDEKQNENNDFLPKLDSIRNFQLPDFENNSFDEYDSKGIPPLDMNRILNEENGNYESSPGTATTIPQSATSEYSTLPPTPVAPLSVQQVKEGHEEFINELSGHKPSIRKPPPSIPPSLGKSPNSNRNELVSVDYANIADAVSGYIDDNEKNKMRDSLAVEKPNFDFEKNASTGSLSTGKLSIDTNNSNKSNNQTNEQNKNESDGDIARRMSTMSQSTFSMGSWQPNTGNFRDQFINDNDNESQINFNPYGTESSNYNKFTKVRNSSGISFSDVASTNSSISVPETIDVPLPSINENNDDDSTSDDDGSFVSHNTSKNDLASTNENKLEAMKTIDSVLKDPPRSKPVFEEERMTPKASSENLGVPSKSVDALDISHTPKYSSLLSDQSTATNTVSSMSDKRSSIGSLKEILTSSHKRLISSATSLTNSSNETPQTQKKSVPYIQQPQPDYNWKKIMATSQPIDRIRLLKDALGKESSYDTGLLNWLNETLKSSQNSSNMHIGKIATAAYKNAAHNDIRRHTSIRSKVNIVKDKVETSGLSATSFGKKFFHRGKKLMKSSGND